MTSILASAFFLAFTSLSALDGQVFLIFIGALATWWSYLLAHRAVEGKFVDGNEDETSDMKTMMPRENIRWLGTMTGVAVLVSGYVVGSKGIRQESLWVTFVAATLFWSGYVISHYGATRELL